MELVVMSKVEVKQKLIVDMTLTIINCLKLLCSQFSACPVSTVDVFDKTAAIKQWRVTDRDSL